MPKSTRLTLPVVPACRDAETPHDTEFASGLSGWDERLSRRHFLTVTAASSIAALAAGGCNDRPTEAIVPYVDPPEQVLAGEPQFFATTLTRNGYGRGVIVTSREGRPTKIEGNPDHPASLGAADAQMQAAVLGLYDPLRSSQVTEAGVPSTWGDFSSALRQRVLQARPGSGELAFLIDSTTSPTIKGLLTELIGTSGAIRLFVHESTGSRTVSADAPQSTLATALSQSDVVLDLATADVIVAFDADFLVESPGSLAYAGQFADRRRIVPVHPAMNRLYVAESDVSVTGSTADHRLAVRPSRVGVLVAALSAQLGVGGAITQDLSTAEAAWLSAAATDLNAARGRSVVIVGDAQPVDVHAWADGVNRHLGNYGKTLRRHMSPAVRPGGALAAGGLNALTNAMKAGRVSTLLILSDNPARTAPSDIAFAKALAELSRQPAAFTAHVGLYANETAYACRWHAPAQHDLEQWGDAAAHDGTTSMLQPLIAPLTNGHSTIDLLNAAMGLSTTALEAVQKTWWGDGPRTDTVAFEQRWAATLRAGVAARPATSAIDLPLDTVDSKRPSSAGIDIAFRPDPSIGDGSLFHNPWLQELPRPITKIVWGNAALISPATAERYNLKDEDVVSLRADERAIETPVLVVPGVADDTAVLHLGYGQHRLVGGDAAWSAANVPLGVDAYPLRTSDSPGFVAGARLVPTGRKQAVVRTHNHNAIAANANSPALRPNVVATPDTPRDELAVHHRKLIRTATLAQLAVQPDFAATMNEADVKQLYPAWDYTRSPQWGMTIDLTACIGCNACITACQAENNTPSVGPEQVAKQREMHWLRVDTYQDDAGRLHHQPVPCMHCENAPCEYVCPVAATTHSVDGLNQMTYNRCVGTRYCSNNCPYKVRRFNFLNYTFYQPEPYKMQRNPDVTVRTRGVMEKCTYCVQRLVYADRKAEIAALDAGDRAEDVRRELFGRLQTACQQTCPTRAIQFGDLTDPAGAVVANKHSPLNYGLLTELSTKPRTTYLASITNPSPMMEPAS